MTETSKNTPEWRKGSPEYYARIEREALEAASKAKEQKAEAKRADRRIAEGDLLRLMAEQTKQDFDDFCAFLDDESLMSRNKIERIRTNVIEERNRLAGKKRLFVKEEEPKADTTVKPTAVPAVAPATRSVEKSALFPK